MNRQPNPFSSEAPVSGLKYLHACRVYWLAVNRAVYGVIFMELAASVYLLLGYLSAPLTLRAGLTGMLLVFAALGISHRVRISTLDTAALLDRLFPGLEESSVLFLKPEGLLNSLERLQVQHLQARLLSLPAGSFFIRLIRKKLVFAFFLILPLGLLVAMPAGLYRLKPESQQLKGANQLKSQTPAVPGPAQCKSLIIHIFPPAYTRKPARTVSIPDLTLVQDSRVSWVIQTSKKAAQVILKLNGKEMLALKPDAAHTRWSLEQVVSKTGFYQLSVENKLSAYYKISVLKDLPPAIHIYSPEQYTTVKSGGLSVIPVNVHLADDYGIRTALMTVTTAKGAGEAIKFKEQKLVLSPAFKGEPLSLDLHQQLHLRLLNIEPGDELYFYVAATDNRGQQSRSDMFYINMADTAKLSLVSGQVKGISPVPEYFRSERQLIMDTEKLLTGNLKPGTAAFKERSNDLGIDQKLLRQRYSKFLGEESESDDQAPAKKEEQPDRKTVAGADAAMNMFTEKPESADEGDSFEPLIKTELKAALSQMFSAEVQLSTFHPRRALPFEYKALTLLKLVQEKTRAYVSKTAFAPSLHQPFEKRLSGDLSKIGQPVVNSDLQGKPATDIPLRRAVAILDQAYIHKTVTKQQILVLEKAAAMLTEKAIEQPGLYLSSIVALQKLLNALNSGARMPERSVRLVQAACMLSIDTPPVFPSRTKVTGSGLSALYFKKISHK